MPPPIRIDLCEDTILEHSLGSQQPPAVAPTAKAATPNTNASDMEEDALSQKYTTEEGGEEEAPEIDEITDEEPETVVVPTAVPKGKAVPHGTAVPQGKVVPKGKAVPKAKAEAVPKAKAGAVAKAKAGAVPKAKAGAVPKAKAGAVPKATGVGSAASAFEREESVAADEGERQDECEEETVPEVGSTALAVRPIVATGPAGGQLVVLPC